MKSSPSSSFWIRTLTESVVIIGSILLALGADAWWENRTERRLEEEYVARLRQEMALAGPSLGRTAQRVRGSVAAMDTILTLDDSPSRSEEEVLDLLARSRDYGFNRFGISFDQTYQEMLATGGLRLIQSSGSREAITRYYREQNRLVGMLEMGIEQGSRRIAQRLTDLGIEGQADLSDPDLGRRAMELLRSNREWPAEIRGARTHLLELAPRLEDLSEEAEALSTLLSLQYSAHN